MEKSELRQKKSNEQDHNLKMLCESTNIQTLASNDSFFSKKRKNSLNLTRCFRTYLKNINTIYMKRPHLLNCMLQKRGERFGQFIDRHYTLTRNYLHIFEDSSREKYKGSLQLNFMTTEFFKDESSNNRFGIRFSADRISEEILTKDEKLFNTLKKILSKITIQKDFDISFKNLEKIGEGSYGDVYKAIETETGDEYACKVYKIGNWEDPLNQNDD